MDNEHGATLTGPGSSASPEPVGLGPSGEHPSRGALAPQEALDDTGFVALETTGGDRSVQIEGLKSTIREWTRTYAAAEARTMAAEARVEALEVERDQLRSKVDCPIGAPERARKYCSAGTCYACLRDNIAWRVAEQKSLAARARDLDADNATFKKALGRFASIGEWLEGCEDVIISSPQQPEKLHTSIKIFDDARAAFAARASDRSGEADATHSGSAEGESEIDEVETPDPTASPVRPATRQSEG